jgi:FkbM family methyltransferase
MSVRREAIRTSEMAQNWRAAGGWGMLLKFLRDSVVNLFGLVARVGLHRVSPFDRLFLASYAIYKEHIEGGPVDRLKDYVSNGSLVIDVGANVGFFCRRFAKWVGEDGTVIALEPEEHNFNTLVRALRKDGLSHRVRALQAVAAAESGTALLEINPLHPADHKLSVNDTGLTVSAVTLDELVRENNSLRPSLIKIDVQGAEMLVLAGAANILRNHGPALFVELHEDGLNRFGSSAAAILGHLSQQGYSAYWLVRSGAPKRATNAEIHAGIARNSYVDVLFLRTLDAASDDQKLYA